jgi:hypothetical protein
MAVAYAEEIGALYLETSAKDDTNVQDIFVKLSKCMCFMSLILSAALSAALVVLSTSKLWQWLMHRGEADWKHRIVRVPAKDVVICPAAFCVWRCTTAITSSYSDAKPIVCTALSPRLPAADAAGGGQQRHPSYQQHRSGRDAGRCQQRQWGRRVLLTAKGLASSQGDGVLIVIRHC